MIVRVLLLVAVALVCATATLCAQLPEIIIRADVGVSVNHSQPDAKRVGPSFDVGAGIGIGPLAVLASVGFDQYLADEEVLASGNPDVWDGASTDVYSIANYPMSVITVAGDLRYRFGDADAGSSFYLTGGPAFFRVSRDDIRITSEKGTRVIPGTWGNAYGFVAGAGFDLAVFQRMIWIYGESKFAAGLAGSTSGFDPLYTNVRVGAEIRLL